MEQATKLTQQQRILKLFRTWGWVSGLQIVQDEFILCYTKRISELRRQGYDIEKRRHHQGFWEYRLKP